MMIIIIIITLNEKNINICISNKFSQSIPSTVFTNNVYIYKYITHTTIHVKLVYKIHLSDINQVIEQALYYLNQQYHTVCPRSIVPSYIATHNIKTDKTFWTYSLPWYLYQMVTQNMLRTHRGNNV